MTTVRGSRIRVTVPRQKRTCRECGFTLIELLIVVAIIGIIAAVAVPGLLRARMTSNETSAIASLRAINSAETSYAGSAGNGGFAVSLAVLGTACPGSMVSFISPDLATDPSVKSGYTVTLAVGGAATPGPLDCNGGATQTAYYSTSVPVSMGTTGNRAFASNANGTIFVDATGLPPTEASMAPGAGGTPIQ